MIQKVAVPRGKGGYAVGSLPLLVGRVLVLYPPEHRDKVLKMLQLRVTVYLDVFLKIGKMDTHAVLGAAEIGVILAGCAGEEIER